MTHGFQKLPRENLKVWLGLDSGGVSSFVHMIVVKGSLPLFVLQHQGLSYGDWCFVLLC